jgi:EAL domain-containing protein (putative c-di-GMP-specific phosphodiesterase class I)/CheY-like chemotaxis protein
VLVNGHTVLVVDDEQGVREAIARVLGRAGFAVKMAENGLAALDLLRDGEQFHAIVTDLEMPGIKGIELVRLIRERDLDVPVIILTGNPTLESAMSAVQYGGFRYLAKPFHNDEIVEIVRSACGMYRLAVLKRRSLELCEAGAWLIGDVAGLDAHFDNALKEIWIAFQPIVRWPNQSVYGYEALVRSTEPTLSNPGLLFEAAERLGRVQELGRVIRKAVSGLVLSAPADSTIFVNLHAADLADDDLYSRASPLSEHAGRVVLEVTERASLHRITNLRERIANLRQLGFQIAVDDLGAGYAGLSSFSQLEPDIAKLDMSLIRGIDASGRKASIVRSMISVCQQELGTSVVCEGVETLAERDTLESLGADLLQGFLFARPERQFRRMSIFAPPG